jgi:hypothetical protein
MDSGETFRPSQDEEQLDTLFQAYRNACPDPDPSPNFMPQLWQKIEARQRGVVGFGRLARHVAAAALALSLIMVIALSLSTNGPSALDESYVEFLAEDHARQNLDYVEPVHFEPADFQR